MEPPRYAHDCAACEYLGRFEHADLYTCAQGGLGQTLLARYGDAGPEYTSVPVRLAERGADLPEIVVALARYRVRG